MEDNRECDKYSNSSYNKNNHRNHHVKCDRCGHKKCGSSTDE